MKILYDYETMIIQKIGGVSRYHYELAKRIKENNDVKVPVIFSQNYYFQDYFQKRAYQYTNRYFKWFLRKINAVRTFIEISTAYIFGRPYDIVHSTFYNPDYIYPYFRLIDKKHRTKYVITIYDMIQEMESDAKLNMRRSAKAKKRALGVADGIISISENTKKDLLKIYPFINEDKIKTIYLSSDKSPETIKNINGLPLKYILFVGQRVVRKNFNRLLLALKNIREDYPDIQLVCTGGGNFSEEESSRIRDLGLENIVIQRFFEDDELYTVYAKAECFIFPSLYEGFGLPILEAWSRNCPVILSDASCFPEIGGDAVLYFDANSELDLENKIRTLLKSNILKNDLRRKGKERLKNFSWEIMADETEKYYKKICRGSR